MSTCKCGTHLPGRQRTCDACKAFRVSQEKHDAYVRKRDGLLICGTCKARFQRLAKYGPAPKLCPACKAAHLLDLQRAKRR